MFIRNADFPSPRRHLPLPLPLRFQFFTKPPMLESELHDLSDDADYAALLQQKERTVKVYLCTTKERVLQSSKFKLPPIIKLLTSR
ncbi:hypothetical protein RJT34_26161 [Clitoria ternatea]|uniref:Uncharacterized protein n=1 Tax=Clitoria ternatea TaxID=43366 RepID=A0AAN9IFK3_CLITE